MHYHHQMPPDNTSASYHPSVQSFNAAATARYWIYTSSCPSSGDIPILSCLAQPVDAIECHYSRQQDF